MKHHADPAGFARLPARRLITAGVIAATIVGASAITAQADSHSSGRQRQLMITTSSLMAGSFAFRTIDDNADPTFNQLLSINDAGRISGYFGSGADATHPNKGYTVSRPYAQANFVSENFPGSVQTQVVGINEHNTTAGFYVDAAGANIGFVRRKSGVFTSVINPATPAQGGVNQLLGLNDQGLAAGFYNDAGGAAHGYVYNFHTKVFSPVTLPVAADSVTATGVNDEGDISGFFTVGKVTSGFVLGADHSFMTILLGGGTNTQALGINEAGAVAGSFVDSAGLMHGFVWSGRRVRQIDDPHHGAGGTLVNGLNDYGQLVGFYVDKAGNTHGFLASHGG